jgi:hypothetical protein
MLPTRFVVRTACRLAACWESRPGINSAPEGPFLERLEGDYPALQAARDRLVMARRHGLSLVLPMLKEDMLARVEDLHQVLDRLRNLLQEKSCREVPSASSLAAELRQLEVEFGGLEVHSKQKAISVTTDPIHLEGINLGPFVIKLCWDRLKEDWDRECFDIIALDPNPASSDEDVTHPHVKDQVLCAGNAAMSINKALEEGRLADAFILVRSVLVTYNPNSPHVSLDAWNGRECYDCGTCLSEDEAWSCDCCDHDSCEDCIKECTSCHIYRCPDCMGQCQVCKRPFCDKCLRISSHSSRKCCCSCLRPCPCCSRLAAKDELDNPQSCPAGRHRNHSNVSNTENLDETEHRACAAVP